MEAYEGKGNGPWIVCELGWKTRLETNRNQREPEKPCHLGNKVSLLRELLQGRVETALLNKATRQDLSSLHLDVCPLLGNRGLRKISLKRSLLDDFSLSLVLACFCGLSQ